MASISGDFSTNLVSHWSLEEASGTRYDAKGDNDLSDINTVTQGTGIQGNCASFDETLSEYLEIDNNSTFDITTKATWSFWMKPSSTWYSYRGIFGKGTFSARTWVAYTSDDRASEIRFLFAGTNFADIGGTFNSGTWYHILISYDGTQATNALKLKGYINGSLATMNYTGTVPSSITNGTGKFYLGNVVGSGGYWNGLLDEFSFWVGSALSATDAATIYNSGTGIPYSAATPTTVIPPQIITWGILCLLVNLNQILRGY